MNKKNLLLIQPIFFNPKMDRNQGTLMPLGLAYVAAYTPSSWNVRIVDEQVEKLDFPEADLVGITTTTGSINRAYEIAKEYRKRGVKVILGGVHASLLPEEAAPYCDSVVSGDAEGIWEEVISDFEKGELKKLYEAPLNKLDNLKLPRRDLINRKYLLGSISTSRGCPFRCTFCSIHNFYKHTYRMRPIEEVISELKGLNSKVLFFTDGNLYGYNKEARERFITLCKRIIEEREHLKFKGWMAYASVNILDDEEALSIASKAGCTNLLIGFESINKESLKEMKKAVNISKLNDYRKLIDNSVKYNIMVTAEIIFGFDNDDKETIELTKEFIKQSSIDVLRLQLLQPLPGTETYKKLEDEDRLYLKNFPEDWLKFRDNFALGVNFKPMKLKSEELIGAVVEIGRDFYSLRNIFIKGIRVLFRYKSIFTFMYFVILAMKSRKMYKNYKVL